VRTPLTSTRHKRLKHRRDGGSDRGSVTVEVLLVGFPIALVMVAFATVVIRLSSGHIDVGNAAASAARSASLERSPGQAITAAQRTANADLAAANSPCRQVTVTVDTGDFRPDGVVRVTVACTVNLADLPMVGLTPSRQVSATSASPIDVYRGVSLGFGNSEVSPGGNRSIGGVL
jgi:Flp pilus assembly protein TadG